MANKRFKFDTRGLPVSQVERNWLIIQTQRYKEKKVCDLLNQMKIEFFLPGQNIKEIYKTKNTFPILPMTIFANINLAELSEILKEVPFCRYLRVPNKNAPFILFNYQIKEIKSTNLRLKKIIQIVNHLIAEYYKTEDHSNV